MTQAITRSQGAPPLLWYPEREEFIGAAQANALLSRARWRGFELRA